MQKNIKETVNELVELIRRHDHLYYVACAPEISDQQYDAMFEKLLRLEAEHPELAHPNSPTSRVGSNLTNRFRKYPHPTPMLSVKSYYNIDSVIASIAKQSVQQSPSGQPIFVVEHKLDGLSISLEYRLNTETSTEYSLFQALTRGNGTEGEDITANIRTIRNIPLIIAAMPERKAVEGRLIIRGEVVITQLGLQYVNKLRRKKHLDPLPNTRNAAATLCMAKTTTEASEAGLEAYFYFIDNDKTQTNNLLTLETLGFAIPEYKAAASFQELSEVISGIQSPVSGLRYPIDGIVIKFNAENNQKSAVNSRYTQRAFALKERSETIQSPFRYIDYSISSAGVVTPVVNFEPVKHNGITYKRAKITWSDLENLEIGKGAVLEISIKGSVSAQITGSSACTDRARPVSKCPACKCELQFGNNACKCINPECPEKTGEWKHLQAQYKMFDAGNQFGSIAALRYAAKDYATPIVRKVKGTSQTLIFYQSIDTLSQIIFNTARYSQPSQQIQR